MNLIRIGCNYNRKGTKLENMIKVSNQGQHFATFVSSVSARKLKCLGSAQLRKFQLELISLGRGLTKIGCLFLLLFCYYFF